MYYIKTTYTATEKNKNNKGIKQVFLKGKNNCLLLVETNEKNPVFFDGYEKAKALANNRGYKNKSAKAFESEINLAEREESEGYWEVKVEWLEI